MKVEQRAEVATREESQGRRRAVIDLTDDGDGRVYYEEEEKEEAAPLVVEEIDGIVVTSSSKLSNPLIKWAHPRFDCGLFPLKGSQDPAEHCAMCCCYVCDEPASKCRAWASHCRARPEARLWKIERILSAHRPPGVCWNTSRCLEVVTDVDTPEPTTWHAAQYMPRSDRRQQQIFARMLRRERVAADAVGDDLTGRRIVAKADQTHALVTGGWIVLGGEDAFAPGRSIPANAGRAGAALGAPIDAVRVPIATLVKICKMPAPPAAHHENFLQSLVARQRPPNNHPLKAPTLVELAATVIVTDDVALWRRALEQHLSVEQRILAITSSLRQALIECLIDLRYFDVVLATPEQVRRNQDVFGLCAFHRLVSDRPDRAAAFEAAFVARAFHVWLLAPFVSDCDNPIAFAREHLQIIGAYDAKLQTSTIARNAQATDAPRSFRGFADYAAHEPQNVTLAGDEHSTLTRLFSAWFLRYKSPSPSRSPNQLASLLGTTATGLPNAAA